MKTRRTTNIPHALSEILTSTTSLAQILEATVGIVAEQLRADVCSIYLLDLFSGRLRLVASRGFKEGALGRVSLGPDEGITGTVVSTMSSIASEDAKEHPSYRYFPATGEEEFSAYLGAPLSVGRRPVGAIVLRNRERRSYTEYQKKTLQTVAAQLVGVIENARLVEALDQPDGGRAYFEELHKWNRGLREYRPTQDGHGEVILRGTAGSHGVAIGKAVVRGSSDPTSELHMSPESAEEERQRLGVAIERTGSDLAHIHAAAERETGEEHALIFSAHLLILSDPTLRGRIEALIDDGLSATQAAHRVFADVEAQLRGLGDPYLKERAEDILDLRARLLGHLTDPATRTQDLSDRIVAAERLSPSMIIELRAEGVLGVATERGGDTSHGALLARAMGVPAVTAVPELMRNVLPGDDLILDGSTGTVIVRPQPETLSKYQEKARRCVASAERLAGISQSPAQSLDGRSVKLLANVGLAAEIDEVAGRGAQGIGLYRTEFLFLGRTDHPTSEEQTRVYRAACDCVPDGPIYFRLLDVGGDKWYARLTLAGEANPALGYRSVRLLLDAPCVFKEQVEAVLRAAGEREVGIIVPLVTDLEEARRAKTLIREVHDYLSESEADPVTMPRIGIMIEVPAAAEIASHLAEEADFLSLGTNDLVQFTLAADRENARVAHRGTPFHPGVLSLVRRTIDAGRSVGKPVGCCGELAAVPELAILLLAMGVDYLSLAPVSIPRVKLAIQHNDIGKLEARLDEILALPEASLVENMLREAVVKPRWKEGRRLE